MEEKAIRGIPWTMLSYAANKALRVVAMLALARLLAPSDFGLVAIAVAAIGAINVLSDLGLGGVLVVRRDLDARTQGTVLTLMLGTGLAAGALVAALAPLAASFFDEPRLTGVVVALAATIPLGVVTWFFRMLLQRELEFRRSFACDVVATVAYVAVAVSLAVAGAGVWSLVAGELASGLSLVAALLALAPYRVRPAFDRGSARKVVREGRGFLAQGGFAFLRENVDYIAVGRLLGTAPVGYYSMAYRIGELPYWGIANPIATTTFPGFARMRHRGEDVGPAFLTTLRLVALVTCPIGLLLSAAADPFTRVVMGESWLPMIGPLAVFGVWASVRTIEVTLGWFLNACDEAGAAAVVSAVTLAALVPAIIAAASLGSITTVAWVMLGDVVVSSVALTVLADRRSGVPILSQARALRGVAIAGVACWCAASLAASAADGAGDGAALVAAVLAGLAAYAAALMVAEPPLLRDSIGQARRALARPSATPAGT